MKKMWRAVYRRSMALFCAVLVLNVHVWIAGCADGGVLATLPNGMQYVAIEPGSPLATALARSAFADASAVEIDPATGFFRFIFPTSKHQLEGTVRGDGSKTSVSSLRLESEAISVSVWLDSEKHITSLQSGASLHWDRPGHWTGTTVGADATDLDAYLAANSELVGFAKQLDQAGGGGTTGPSNPAGGPGQPSGPSAKVLANGQPSQGDLTSILGILVGVLALQAVVANFPAVVFVVQVVVSLQVTMALLGITPITPQPIGGETPNNQTNNSGAQAFLEVQNQLSSGDPIWVVALATEGNTGTDMLSGQSIPSGGKRTFGVIAGQRDVVIRVPSSTACSMEFVKKGVTFTAGETQAVTLTDEDTGVLIPAGCGG